MGAVICEDLLSLLSEVSRKLFASSWYVFGFSRFYFHYNFSDVGKIKILWFT